MEDIYSIEKTEASFLLHAVPLLDFSEVVHNQIW